MITIPLSLGLEALVGLVAGLIREAAFIGSAAITDVSSSALEEEVSSASFNSLLLLTLLFSEIGEISLLLLFFFSFTSSSEGLHLAF